MSAFIVSDETINRVIAFLHYKTSARYYYPLHIFEGRYDLSDRGTCESLAQAMFALNVEAVKQGYPHKAAEEFRPLDFQFRLVIPGDSLETLKDLECWLYQCTEGSVVETELFKLMEETSHLMALDIVHNLPAYGR